MTDLKTNLSSTSSLFLGPEKGSQELRRAGTSDEHGSRYIAPWTTPYIIGVGGSSGSGKTSVAAKLISSINTPWTVLISLDNFYKPLTEEQRQLAFDNNFDFDEPDAVDLDLAYECFKSLKEGKKTSIPVYSFVDHNRIPGKSITLYGCSVVVIEGIYALHDQRILDLMDLKIFVDVDLDVCLARRLSRDIISRGRDLNGCISQWEKFVKPNAEKYVNPSMKNADVIIPSMGNNAVATQTVINHIKSKLASTQISKAFGGTETLGSWGGFQAAIRIEKCTSIGAYQPGLSPQNNALGQIYFQRRFCILL